MIGHDHHYPDLNTVKLNLFTQESVDWSGFDSDEWSRVIASISGDRVAQSQLPSQNATGTDAPLARIDPYTTLDPGSGLHHYVSQDVLDPQPLPVPPTVLPTDLDDDFWGSPLDGLQSFEVNIIILHQMLAHPPSKADIHISRLSETF